MLEALFDKYINHVGWIDRDGYIFDVDLNWVAYVHNETVWSKEKMQWIGKVNGVICMDKDGRVVAWGIGQRVAGDPSVQKRPKSVPPLPEAPTGLLRPQIPSPPIPAMPLMGWSTLTFDEWLLQE